MRMLELSWSRALGLVCKVAPALSSNFHVIAEGTKGGEAISGLLLIIIPLLFSEGTVIKGQDLNVLRNNYFSSIIKSVFDISTKSLSNCKDFKVHVPNYDRGEPAVSYR